MRGVGILDAVTQSVPEWSVPVWAALTVLGAPELVVVAAVLAYWVGDRFSVFTRLNGLRLFMVVVSAVAVVTGAKLWFGLPRPVTPSVAYAADGFGFPSGHAASATAFFLAGAALSRVSTRNRLWGVGVGVVAMVGVSRLVLGVHYAVDVVAGILVGGCVTVVVVGLTRNRVWPGFGVAVVAGVGTTLIAWVTPTVPLTQDALIAGGGTVGAAVAWAAVTLTDTSLARPTPWVLGVGGVTAGVPLGWVVLTDAGSVVTVVAAVVAGGVAVAVPAVRTFRGTGPVPTR